MQAVTHRRSRIPTKPREVQNLCLQIANMAMELLKETPEMHDTCYSRFPGPGSERVRVNGSRPTEDLALHGGSVKHHYNRACSRVLSAHVALVDALNAFHEVIGTADEQENLRDPEGVYGRRITPDEQGWEVSPRELLEARKAQQRRRTG